MKNWTVEYTTNIDDRHTVTMEGTNKTQVYLKFVAEYPKHYIITKIKEKEMKNDQD